MPSPRLDAGMRCDLSWQMRLAQPSPMPYAALIASFLKTAQLLAPGKLPMRIPAGWQGSCKVIEKDVMKRRYRIYMSSGPWERTALQTGIAICYFDGQDALGEELHVGHEFFIIPSYPRQGDEDP